MQIWAINASSPQQHSAKAPPQCNIPTKSTSKVKRKIPAQTRSSKIASEISAFENSKFKLRFQPRKSFQEKRQEAITSNKTQRTINNTSHRFSKHAFGNTRSTPSTSPKGREPMVTHDTNSKNASGKSDEHSRETKEHLPLLKAHFRTSKRGSHHPGSTKNNSKRLLQALHKGIKKLPRPQQISKPILDLFYLHHKNH